ncbi:hypothetical protein HED60_18725 [Planctomycetales bacterium ZRK34]|nr:hypothetical protein HED60_18725 [Planctomycetales bacterium ZRK34]
MATGKDPSPLFDIVRGSRRPQKTMELPEWMRRQQARQASESVEPQATPIPERAESSPRNGASAGGWHAALTRWWTFPMAFRLPRGTVVMLGIGALVVVILAYLIGHRIGRSDAVAFNLTYEKANAAFDPIREKPAQRLIPSTVDGVSDADSIGVPDLPGASGEADPREPGLNYFRLTSIPASASEVVEILDFLKSHGVDAAAIPINNGRSVKIVALRGFANPLSDPDARAFAEQLKKLGRRWKSQERGSSDWKDLYPEKYRPGRN